MQAFELEIIQQALAILDSHLKTKGEAMQSPGEVASYLRLQLEQVAMRSQWIHCYSEVRN